MINIIETHNVYMAWYMGTGRRPWSLQQPRVIENEKWDTLKYGWHMIELTSWKHTFQTVFGDGYKIVGAPNHIY